MCECIEENDIVGLLEIHGVSGSFFENHRGDDAKVILDNFTQLIMSLGTSDGIVEEVVENEEENEVRH